MNTRSTAQLNWLGTLLLGTLLWNLGSAVAGGDERPVSFLRDVAPILVQRCEGCHGPQQSESSYRVDTVAYLLAEGDYGEAQVTAGSLEESLLWQLVSTDDGDLRMPKDGEPLPPRELQAIRSWIEQGATVDLPQPEQPLATQLLRPEYAPPPEAYRAAVPITALAVEPQSGNILTGGYREWTLWSAQDGSLLKRLPHVTERTTTLEFSADSSLLATSGGVPGVYGEVRILDSKDYSERQLLAKTTDIVSGLAFRPDGQELAAAFPDLTVRIYELATGKERLKIESHGDRINSVHWSPDGTRLVSTSWDQTTKVFDAQSGQLVVNYEQHQATVFHALFSPDGTHVYSGGDDGKIHYWKVEDGARQRLLAHDGAVYGLRITGDFLFSYSADRTARQFTLSDHSLVRTFGGHDDWLTALAVDSQRQRLLTGTFSGHVRVLGLEDGSELSGFLAAPGLTPQPQPH